MRTYRIIITGLIGSIPLPGLTYHYLQYVLGLRALGHEVHYLEHTGQWNYNLASDGMVAEGEGAAAYLHRVMEAHDLPDRWTFINHDGATFGVSGTRFRQLCESADLFINVTGANLIEPPYDRIPWKVYLDTDPGYVQFRAATGSQQDLKHLATHDAHASFGLNIHGDDCAIPTLGLRWHPTVQPIDMDLWTTDSLPDRRVCVTVMKWHTYDDVEHGGETYGNKSSELLRFMDLPRRTIVPLELAVLGSGPSDEFTSRGWHWRDARNINGSLDSYRAFLRGASAEWTVAKSAYVKSRSGWIGDRAATMLALGRPVILQSTGWEKHLPTGRGLLHFSTVDEAAEALDEVWANYDVHARCARAIAHEAFAAPTVLKRLLDDVVI